MTTVLPLRRLRLGVLVGLFVSAMGLLVCGTLAQQIPFGFPKKQQKRAAELIRKQEPPMVIPRVLERATPDNVSIYISLGKQRVYFRVYEENAVDSPISSGKRAGMTPPGSYRILEKDADHRSNIYGDFVNARTGRVVRAGISTRIDSAPSGTVYRGAPMRWFMRLSPTGVGMHTGILPGYPASHGCIRLPEEIARLFYDRVRIGTPVTIGD
jgi:lipoprotein-anchoring transpeptidase ErfK/SrfK